MGEVGRRVQHSNTHEDMSLPIPSPPSRAEQQCSGDRCDRCDRCDRGTARLLVSLARCLFAVELLTADEYRVRTGEERLPAGEHLLFTQESPSASPTPNNRVTVVAHLHDSHRRPTPTTDSFSATFAKPQRHQALSRDETVRRHCEQSGYRAKSEERIVPSQATRSGWTLTSEWSPAPAARTWRPFCVAGVGT